MSTLKALLVAMVAVFAPIKAMLITVGVLIGADMVLGIWAAIKRKERISSAALRRTISKSCIYLGTVCLGYICEVYLLGSLIPVSKLIAGTIGLVEMKSILESADEINGGSVFKALVAKLGSKNDELQ